MTHHYFIDACVVKAVHLLRRGMSFTVIATGVIVTAQFHHITKQLPPLAQIRALNACVKAPLWNRLASAPTERTRVPSTSHVTSE
jgi:hypothetical protein